MSVIQQIQEKYAKLMAVIIALALIIFVVMLAFENQGGLFRGNDTAIGTVDGASISYPAFAKRVSQQEEYMKSQGYPGGGAATQQAIEAVWSQEVNKLLLTSELDKLGMNIGKRELGDVLYGETPPQYLQQLFTDPATGQYDAQKAKTQIDQTLRSGTQAQKEGINEYIIEQEFLRRSEKYTSLLSGSINFPKWMVEKEIADNSQIAKISFVREFYTSIPDSAAKVSNEEITKYVNDHKDQYKQEENRGIAYVTFSALPTASDSADATRNLLEQKPAFDSTKDVKLFLESQGVRTYYDGYINGANLQVPNKDSILKTPVNTIYGPYLDATNYSLAKIIAVRTQPDTVNVRHILIGTVRMDQQTGQQVPLRDSATAYKLADSIRLAIAGGANFDTLVTKFSDDEGSKAKGGLYEKVTAGGMVPKFNDYIFGNPVGTKGIVNTEFGSHYIEILSQKGSSSAYKIAYLSQPIEASSETDANANGEATNFAGNSRDEKSFDANVDKLKSKGVLKMFENNISPNAYQIGALGASRELVRSIYDAKLGQVLQPVRVGEQYVVAMVTEINEKGTMPASVARPLVEPILRNQKKAEQIIKKAGNATSLEAAATAWGGKAIETADSLRFDGLSASVVSNEYKVIGAAFNPANKGKVTPAIEGTSGVFFVRVDNVSATPVMTGGVPEQRKQRQQQAQMQYQQGGSGMLLNALKEASSIKDSRSKYY